MLTIPLGLDVLAPFAALVAHSSDSMHMACDNVSQNSETAHDLLFMLHSCFDASSIVVAAKRVGRGGLCDYYLLGTMKRSETFTLLGVNY